MREFNVVNKTVYVEIVAAFLLTIVLLLLKDMQVL